MYIIMALPHGGIHALLGVAGIFILLVSYYYFKRRNKYVIERVLNLTGVLSLVLSLYFFFFNDRQGYNSGTFEQLVPQITLSLFGILTVGFIVSNFLKQTNKQVKGIEGGPPRGPQSPEGDRVGGEGGFSNRFRGRKKHGRCEGSKASGD